MIGTNFSRRHFLKVAAAGIALATTHPLRRASAHALRDDPILTPPEPLHLSQPEPGLFVGRLVAVKAPVLVPYVTDHAAGHDRSVQAAELLTYNGLYPGPLIQIPAGATLRLAFTNMLGSDTNLHTHGLHVAPQVDDPFLRIPPGATHVYEYDIPSDTSGTYWYHPHVHGTVSEQLFGGLAGPIVVEHELDAMPELASAEEHVIVLKDLTVRHGRPEPHLPNEWVDGKRGEHVLVNGLTRPVLRTSARRLRLRLVNACTSRFFRLALDGHPLHVIGTDGGFLERPHEREELLLPPGGRADVLVDLTRPGTFRVCDLPYQTSAHAHDHDVRSASHHPEPSDPSRHASSTIFTIEATSAGEAQPLPTYFRTIDRPPIASAAPHRLVTLQHGLNTERFAINGQEFRHHANPMFTAQRGTTEVWEIRNEGHTDHPFHLHTYPFQVIERNGRPESLRAWHDTVNVRPSEGAKIAIPLTTHYGRTVFHCHVTEHEDRGMMAILDVTP